MYSQSHLPQLPLLASLPPRHLCQNQLLLRLELLHHSRRNLQRAGHDVGRGQGEPLGEADVDHPIALVDLDPDQRLVARRVLHKVAGVVREDGRVAGGEVEGAGGGAADEDGGAGVA